MSSSSVLLERAERVLVGTLRGPVVLLADPALYHALVGRLQLVEGRLLLNTKVDFVGSLLLIVTLLFSNKQYFLLMVSFFNLVIWFRLG